MNTLRGGGHACHSRRRAGGPALVLALALLVGAAAAAQGQQIQEMQFANQPVTDILLALAEVSGQSIIPDETVTGTASYYFSQTDFETALELFLFTYKMYYVKEGGVYYVSRIRSSYDAPSGTVSMDAEDVEIPFLIQAASRAIGKTILYDPLPNQRLTVHVTRVRPDKLLEILIRRFPDFRVVADEDYYYVNRVPPKPPEPTVGGTQARAVRVSRQGTLYSLNVRKDRFQEVVGELFREAGMEYSLLARKDIVLEDLRFENKDFQTMLRLILDQAAADYARVGEVYYIFEMQGRDVLKKLKTSLRIPLHHLAAKELAALFPADLLSAQLFKIDATRNAVILSGSLEELAPVQEFIRKLDQPVAGMRYHLFRLNHLSAAKIQGLLPPEYRYIEPTVLPDSNAFVALLSDDTAGQLRDYLTMIDVRVATETVRLNFIKAEDLLKRLPPSIAKEEILETNDPSVVFVRTSPEKLQDFYADLEVIDKPVPQIRYQLLVIQYRNGESLNWSDGLEASTAAGGPDASFMGTIGKLLNLSFDVVSAFGVQFAVQLNLDLSESDARVLADTTVVGLSGQEINFQNTDTFRYQEVEVDEEGNTRYTGVTREITSGLIFKIQGWVSGDGMITLDVKATVSKRGTVSSASVGALPTTSENVVNTRARTLSGEPVVIGGLMRQETNIELSKLPLLGDIPGLGVLFQSRKDSVESSELVIYILPRVEYGVGGSDAIALELERLYAKFAKR